ncbi:uncharacterized protein TNCV_667491 [Trichonephila clavipes]|nr:uncharacterized protein TNCV_667491 [Trichonephila clavipes]
MESFINTEQADMHLIYGLTEGNAQVAERLYRERYPQADAPNRWMFINLPHNLCKYGSLRESFEYKSKSDLREERFVLGTLRSKRIRVLYRSRQNDRPLVMLALVHIDITPPHTPLPVFWQIGEQTIPYSWRACKQLWAANESQLSLYQHPIREQPLSSQPCQKTLNISHPDEARLPRLPDSMDQPITAMPLSRMQNPTLAKPHIEVITTRD